MSPLSNLWLTDIDPADPVFFLHHAQVDRLWWSWQQISSERKNQYNGIARNDSLLEAQVTDVLEFGASFPTEITVDDMMDTEGGILCYQYDVSAI